MPAPLTTVALALSIGAAILGVVAAWAIFAAVGALWEIFLFVEAGRARP